MTAEPQAQEIPLADEGFWAYLIGPLDGHEDAAPLRERMVEVCEASGWPAISWSPAESGVTDPGHFFEGVRHAVEHADFVVALLGSTEGWADGELAMAYGHRRPIVGICLSDEDSSIAKARTTLESYELARVISCDDVDECAAGLRDVLADPDFAATVHTAAREIETDG